MGTYKLHEIQPREDGLYIVTGRNGQSSVMHWSKKDQFGHLTYVVYSWSEMSENDTTIAKRLMEEVAHSNGVVNRGNPMTFPEKHLNQIAPVANKFFKLHPHLYNDADISSICDGDYDENQEMYGELEGYKELDKALNDYFVDL